MRFSPLSVTKVTLKNRLRGGRRCSLEAVDLNDGASRASFNIFLRSFDSRVGHNTPYFLIYSHIIDGRGSCWGADLGRDSARVTLSNKSSSPEAHCAKCRPQRKELGVDDWIFFLSFFSFSIYHFLGTFITLSLFLYPCLCCIPHGAWPRQNIIPLTTCTNQNNRIVKITVIQNAIVYHIPK